MATSVQLVPALRAHAEALAPLMRAEDAAEVLASGGYGPLEALLDALSMPGGEAWACLFDGEVAALFGTAPLRARASALGGRTGVVWLLGGRALARNRKAFVRTSRQLLPLLFEPGGGPVYSSLINYVDARYAGALRWAAALGATVHPPEPFGAARMPFHRITFTRGALSHV